MTAHEWLQETYRRLDARDLDGFLERVTDDIWVRFGNAQPVHGKEAVREAFEAFFESVGGLRHLPTRVWDEDGIVGLEADVDYRRTDGSVVRVPTFVAWRLREGLGARCQVFADLSPVFDDDTTPPLCDGSTIDVVHQAGLESFPASDPPGWTP